MMYTLTTLVWGAAETNFGTPAVYPWKFPMQYMCTKLLEPRSINDTIAQFVTLAKQYTAWANLIGSNNMLPTYRLFNYQRYRCIWMRARNRRGAVPLIRHAPSRCTQIPIWNGYDADSRLFYPGPLIGPELLLANCKIDFGGGLIPNAHKTNLRFAGGRKPQFARTAGNIAFINDLWDPTHSLTPMRDLSSSVKAINLPNMAHGGFLVGLILYPNPADRPPEFEQAIDTVGGLISSWIAEYHEQSRWLAEEQGGAVGGSSECRCRYCSYASCSCAARSCRCCIRYRCHSRTPTITGQLAMSSNWRRAVITTTLSASVAAGIFFHSSNQAINHTCAHATESVWVIVGW